MKYPPVLSIILAALVGPLTAAPINDNFDNATLLNGTSVEAIVDLIGATRQTGEPNPWGPWAPPPDSVWFKWTATATGTAFIDSLSENGGGQITVYTGTTVSALTQVGVDPYETYSPPASSYWKINAVAGTTYRIAVWKAPWNSFVSDRISVFQAPLPPANDNFAAATGLPADGAVFSATGYTYVATEQPLEPDVEWFGYPPFFPTIWYSFTANFTGLVEFKTSAATCPVQIIAYAGSSLTSLTKLSSNVAADPSGTTAVRWKCTAGTTYRVRIAGWDYPGLGRFTVAFAKLNPAPGVRTLIAEARIRLENQAPGCIQAADALLQQALALTPADPEANFLRALTRLALVGETAGFKSLVTTLTGDATPSLDPYADKVAIISDLEGDPVLPVTSNPHELAKWLGNAFLPELAAIRAHLNQVPASLATSLSGAETGAEEHLEIDYADVKALAATTHALEMLVDLITTYDLSVSLRNLILWDKEGKLTSEQVRKTYTNLLRFSATNRRTQFRQQFTQLRLAGEAALHFARNSRTQPLLHLWDTADVLPADEQALIDKGRKVESSFGGATVTLGHEKVNLSRFTSATASLRDWLPTIAHGGAIAGTLPDPSFGGIFPELGQSRANTLLAEVCTVLDLGTFGSYVGSLMADLPMAERGQTADPDRDQRDNFREYAFGGDPTKPDLERQVAAVVQTAGADITNLQVSFSRRRGLRDVTYVVAVSDDLLSWDRSWASVSLVAGPVANDDGLTETVQYSIYGFAGGNPPRFVRLEATLQPPSAP